jgi:hypothetical protein
MPILIKEPITIPSKTFDKYWACSINITAQTPTSEVEANLLLLPFDSKTGETHEAGIVPMKIENIMAKCAANPTGNFAKAMFYLLAAIEEEKTVQDNLEEEIT